MNGGIKLTLPGGGDDTFEAQGNISVVYKLITDYLVNPAGAIASSYNEYVEQGGQGIGDGLGQNVYLGPIPIHQIELRFDKWEGETGAEWGGVAADASRLKKLQKLDYELNTRAIDSARQVKFEHGDYSDGGDFGPLPVVVKDSNLAFDAAEGPTTMTSNLTLLESIDATDSIDNRLRNPK
jgi:hypothetical protein